MSIQYVFLCVSVLFQCSYVLIYINAFSSKKIILNLLAHKGSIALWLHQNKQIIVIFVTIFIKIDWRSLCSMKIIVVCIHTEHTRNVNKVDYVVEFKFRTTFHALLVFKSPFYF